MKKIITFCCFIITVASVLIGSGTFSSCAKQNTNCTAVVTVMDTVNGSLVACSGAAVKLYAPHGQVQGNGVTNSSGVVSFTFALPAIFNISASKGVVQGDTLKGSGIIQLEIGSTVSASVTIH